MSSDPIQGVLDRQPPIPPRCDSILRRRRVGSPRGTVQRRIRQTQTFRNHRFLSLRSGQLRNRIGLIQTQLTGGKPLPKQRQILQPAGHEPAEPPPNDATRSGQTPTAPDSGNHPPGKVDPDPPPSTNRTPRPKPPPKDSENGRYPHRPDRSNTPSPCLTTYREAVTETGQKTRIRKEIREISGRFNSRRRAPAAPLDPGGPMRTPHAAIRCPDRSRPQPGSSLPFDSRSSRHGPPPRPG